MKHLKLLVVFVTLCIDLLPAIAMALEALPNPSPTPGEQRKPEQNTRANEDQKAHEPKALAQAFPSANAQQSASVSGPQIQQPGPQPSQCPSDDRIVWLTGGLLVVTFVQACIYFRQAQLMKSTLKETQRSIDHAIRMERPWIQVEPIQPKSLTGMTQDGLEFGFSWSVKNVGRSPAFLTKVYFAVVPDRLPAPHEELPYKEPDDPIAEFLLPPNGERQFWAQGLILPPDLEGIRSGEKLIIFYGRVEYRGTGGEGHYTRFFSYWCSAGSLMEDLWTFFPTGPPHTTEYT